MKGGKKRRKRPIDELPYFCRDPAQMKLPLDLEVLDAKGRLAVEAAEAARLAQVFPWMMAFTEGGQHGEK